MNLDLSAPIKFSWKGYFSSPNENWMHMSREIDSYELFYITEGILYISDGENNYTVKKGEYLITPPCKNQHGWKPSSCKFYYFHFYASNAGKNFSRQGAYADVDMLEKYYSLLSRSGTVFPSYNHLLSALLLELKSGGKVQLHTTVSEACRSVQDYIKFAPSEQLRVSLIAEKFKYNAKYLSQSFKKEMGISLKKYLKNEIISRAKHMLSHTALSIGEISEQLGCSDAHSFSHIFKNDVGVSPKKYRTQTA